MIKTYFKELLLILLIAVIITYGWQGLELIMYGEVQPREVDNIIATILLWSIYLNIKCISILRSIKSLIERYLGH